jgi:GxxExxY protein
MTEHFAPIPDDLNAIATQVVDGALEVHRRLGPGLLESVYEACLCHELSKRCVQFQRQVNWPIQYDSVRIDAGLRLDLLVEDRLIVELKAVEKRIPLFDAQMLTYLKLAEKRLGLLINFNVSLLKDGVKRMIR